MVCISSIRKKREPPSRQVTSNENWQLIIDDIPEVKQEEEEQEEETVTKPISRRSMKGTWYMIYGSLSLGRTRIRI